MIVTNNLSNNGNVSLQKLAVLLSTRHIRSSILFAGRKLDFPHSRQVKKSNIIWSEARPAITNMTSVTSFFPDMLHQRLISELY
jgi:hypothetical protein